jgi:zinc transporter 9
MADLGAVVFMALALGALSFGIGILPLSFAFSRKTAGTACSYRCAHAGNMLGAHVAKLSTFGTGLLLGAALGVIIPESVPDLVSLARLP